MYNTSIYVQNMNQFTTNTGNDEKALAGNASTLSLQFPEELGTNSLMTDGKNLEHFCVFYINTMQNDRYFSKDGGTMLRKINSSDKPAYESVSRAANVLDVVSDKDQTRDSITEKLLRIHSWTRTTMMIALPMPMQISKTYSANWGTTSTAGNTGMDILASIAAKGVAGGIKQSLSDAVQAFLNKSSTLAARSGSVANPRAETLFESISPGNNTLDWTLYPRTPQESKSLWDIIQVLKWCMLPDIEENGVFYNIPNTVDLEYWHGDKRNDWLPRSMTSYIRDVNVNYCPSSHWVALDLDQENDNWPTGAPPVGVSISISLGELIPLDKRIIDPDSDLTFGLKKQGIF